MSDFHRLELLLLYESVVFLWLENNPVRVELGSVPYFSNVC